MTVQHTDSEDFEAERWARIAVGMDELSRWLRDQVRGGLGALQNQPFEFWDAIAARMVDAGMSGLARALRRLSSMPIAGEDWPARMLEQFGRLHLLVEGFRRYDSLSPELRADMRVLLGLAPQTEAVTVENALQTRDCWLLIGRNSDTEVSAREKPGNDFPNWLVDETRTYVTRRWFLGAQSGFVGLTTERSTEQPPHMNTQSGNQTPLQPSVPEVIRPGTAVKGMLAFRSSAYPLDAQFENTIEPVGYFNELPGMMEVLSQTARETIPAALRDYAEALACNPWLEIFPLMLRSVIPHRFVNDKAETWVLSCATTGATLPIAKRFTGGWHLLALSGGGPISVCGEWDGTAFFPFGVWGGERYAAW